MAVPATVLLYLPSSVSVVVFLRRQRVDSRVWNTHCVAPLLGALGIAGAIRLILANFTTLIGGEDGTVLCPASQCPSS